MPSQDRWTENLRRWIEKYILIREYDTQDLSSTSNSSLGSDPGHDERELPGTSTVASKGVRPVQIARFPKRMRSEGVATRFVDILVEAVEKDLANTRLEDRIQSLQADIEHHQKQHDSMTAYYNALASRVAPEIQGIVDEVRQEVQAHYALLHTQWRDEHGRGFTCGLWQLLEESQADLRQAAIAKKLAVRRLVEAAPSTIHASLDTDVVGGFQLTDRFCSRLRFVALSAQALAQEETEATRQRESLGAWSVDKARVRARQAYRAFMKTLEVKRHNQDERIAELLQDTARPLLVEQGILIPEASPTLPPTPASLRRRSRSSFEGYRGASHDSASSSDEESSERQDPELQWRRTAKRSAECEQHLEELQKAHAESLADYLCVHESASLQSAERNFERNVGDSYENQRRIAQATADAARQEYLEAQRAAEAAGVQLTALSPVALADRDTDGHTESAGTAWRATLAEEAQATERKILRWSRNVAIGVERNEPGDVGGFSISSLGSRRPSADFPERQSSARLIGQYQRAQEGLRPAVEAEVRKSTWEGRLRSHTPGPGG